MEMTVRGKGGKPKAGFPAFPLPLETPQKPRAFHISTAPTTAPYIYTARNPKKPGRKHQPRGWAKLKCRSGPTVVAKRICQQAQISGFVEDPAGLAVGHAEVSVRSEETGGRRSAQSNSSGQYTVAALNPGLYRISIRAEGFRTAVREGVKLEIGDSARLDFSLRIGDSRTVVTVDGDPPILNTQDASVGTVIGRDFIDQMPLNGRGIQTLIELTPGVEVIPVTPASAGQFTVNGQRSDANYFTVDGVSANFAAGVPPTATGSTANTIGQAGGAALPANSLLGTFSNLVSPDALEEFKIQTSTFAPEFGRMPGAQIGLVSRAGSRRYSGTLFEYIRNDAADANDWFANELGLPKSAFRFNNFGGTLGGPVRIPHLYDGRRGTFFFFSSEGLLTQQPQQPNIMAVPTLQARASVPSAGAPLEDMYPLPNRPGLITPGWGTYVSDYSLPHRQQNYSLRLDHYMTDKLTAFLRFNDAPSRVTSEPDLALPVTTLQDIARTKTLTLGVTLAFSPSLINDLRVNGSWESNVLRYDFNSAGGAVQPSEGLLLPPGYTLANSGVSIMGGVLPGLLDVNLGLSSKLASSQFQLVDQLSDARGAHQFKLGIDYRLFFLKDNQPKVLLTDSYGAFSTPIANFTLGIYNETPVSYRLPEVSSYAQDTWRVTRSLTLTYGLRWEVDFAPRDTSANVLVANPLANWNALPNVMYEVSARPFFRTTYTNFAPRLGLAWEIFSGKNQTVLRAGTGTFYDLNQNGFENSLAGSIRSASHFDVPLGVFPAGNTTAPLYPLVPVAAPGYTLPRTYEWNIALEQSLGSQTFSAAYLGAIGRRLIGTTTVTGTPGSPEMAIFGNEFSSSYNSLQLQMNRRLGHSVQAMVSYTWSHSIDNLSNDLGSTTSLAVFEDPNLNRGDSDFDVRHSLHGAVFAKLPSPLEGLSAVLFRNWTASSVSFARSALPTDLFTFTTNPSAPEIRPDVVPGQPHYLYGSGYPGGKAYNPSAFVASPPAAVEGDLGRNVLRGFGAWQVDFALHRQFQVSERVGLQFRAEAFNIFNHPNFANPWWLYDPSRSWVGAPKFGNATATLASGLGSQGTLGELNPLFQVGGPRSLQFALRLTF
jgi:hypothetical protein